MDTHRCTASFPVRLGLLFLLSLPLAVAHHAPTEFDFDRIIEIQGEIVEVKWGNPHIAFKVRAKDAAGQPVLWDVEASSISMLRRMNAAAERFQVNDKVRVAGNPTLRPTHKLYGQNLLQANGREIVFQPEGKQRWKSQVVGNVDAWFDDTTESSQAGIFRVWSTNFGDPWMAPVPRERLTATARATADAWDPAKEPITVGCNPVGMPMIMAQPYPIEFIQQDERILLRIELYDLERTIHMSRTVKRASLPTHILGRSTGRWENDTLIVETDGIAWPYLGYDGVPLSRNASLVERFKPSKDGKRLEYSVVVTDPEYLTQPVEATRAWIARPNESVKPYNCGAEAPPSVR